MSNESKSQNTAHDAPPDKQSDSVEHKGAAQNDQVTSPQANDRRKREFDDLLDGDGVEDGEAQGAHEPEKHSDNKAGNLDDDNDEVTDPSAEPGKPV